MTNLVTFMKSDHSLINVCENHEYGLNYFTSVITVKLVISRSLCISWLDV